LARAAEARRAAIVEAAAVQFHHGGIQGTALADVARAASVAPGNMFTYFKTKDELSRAVAKRWSDRVRAILAEVDSASADPATRIRLFVARSRGNAPAYAEQGCPLAMLSRDFRQLALAPEPAAEPFRILTAWLADAFAAAGDAKPAQHATFLVAGLQGAFLLAHAEGQPTLVEDVADDLLAWVDGLGLGKPRATP
jgi:AcrR family transcriptional regulator